ncbi:MAG: hypothetical protein ACRD21_04045 [Vicinamibacteria bacterium]
MLRIVLVVGLSVLLGALTVIDPFFCPDGCGDEPIRHAESMDSVCAICLGLGPPVFSRWSEPAELLEPPHVTVVTIPASLESPSIDHPPRAI